MRSAPRIPWTARSERKRERLRTGVRPGHWGGPVSTGGMGNRLPVHGKPAINGTGIPRSRLLSGQGTLPIDCILLMRPLFPHQPDSGEMISGSLHRQCPTHCHSIQEPGYRHPLHHHRVIPESAGEGKSRTLSENFPAVIAAFIVPGRNHFTISDGGVRLVIAFFVVSGLMIALALAAIGFQLYYLFT